jgi:putative aminopeptidase FrvX
MDLAELLKELTEARGPSGYEKEVRELVSERLAALADEVRVDAVGNLIALKRGERPRSSEDGTCPSVMLAAHMDEVAFMVSKIEKGFLHIVEIGGCDPRILLAQRVTVHGARELSGQIVTVPPHFTQGSEREKPVPMDKLFVDVGLPPEEVERLVKVGDVITFAARYTPLASGTAYSKSMDDRASVAALALCMEELQKKKHSWDVFAVATVQEEETGMGAVAGAYHLEPTIGIAVDVTFAQQPGLQIPETLQSDHGPSIAMGPNINPRVFDRLVEAARAIEMPYQIEPVPGNTFTDAWNIQVSRSGIPTGLVSIPLRYMHSPVETVVLRDIERAGRLLAEFTTRLDASAAASFSAADAYAEPARPGGSGSGLADGPDFQGAQ